MLTDMDTDNRADLITFMQNHALFGGLDDAAMAAILPLLREEQFPSGAFIVREGDPGDRMHFILSGTAEVVKDATPDIHDDHELAQLSLLKPGDAFGEMGLIDVQARSASVRALESVRTASLTNKDLHKLYRTNTELFTMIILNLARELSRRLRKMNNKAAWRTA